MYMLWGGEGGTYTHTHRHTNIHINTMTRPSLGAGPSENPPAISTDFPRLTSPLSAVGWLRIKKSQKSMCQLSEKMVKNLNKCIQLNFNKREK